VVKIAEAVGRVVVVVPVNIKLLNSIVHILAKFHIPVCRPATFILVCWDVNPEAFQIRKAISCDQDFCSFSLNHLDALVVISWTHLTPIPSVIKVVQTTARMSANTDIADESIFQTCLKGRDGRKKKKRHNRYNEHHVSQRGKMRLAPILVVLQICNS